MNPQSPRFERSARAQARRLPRRPLLGLVAAATLGLAGPGRVTAAPAKPNTVSSAKIGARAAKKAADAGTAPESAPAIATPPPADSSPLAELRKANAQLKKLIGNKRPSWSPETDAKNAEMKKVVDQFLDFEELARRSLAKHWDGLTPAQRTEFVSTLRGLAERNYVRQVYGQPDYELKLEQENKTGNEATVTGTLEATNKGKKVTMSLEYRMLWKNGRWVVYDLVTDELSLLENYRAEFNKIIAKEGFDKLLERMRKKLKDKPAE